VATTLNELRNSPEYLSALHKTLRGETLNQDERKALAAAQGFVQRKPGRPKVGGSAPKLSLVSATRKAGKALGKEPGNP